MEIRRFADADLEEVLRLCRAEGYPTHAEDPARALRALTAPGVTTVVADTGSALAGVAQMQSDGEIQAHLSLIVVDPSHRRQGIARSMIETAFRLTGALRIDLVTDSADDFYRALPHIRMSGYRLYPDYSGPDRYRPGLVWKDGRRKDG